MPWLPRQDLLETSKCIFLLSRGNSKNALLSFLLYSTKSSGRSLTSIAASARMLPSSGRPYLFRATECRNWQYSQSCTCKVAALRHPCLVLAWLQIRGSSLNFEQIVRSTFPSTSQNCFAGSVLAVLMILRSACSASFLSDGAPF